MAASPALADVKGSPLYRFCTFLMGLAVTGLSATGRIADRIGQLSSILRGQSWAYGEVSISTWRPNISAPAEASNSPIQAFR
jgi:hypothetical protein